MTQMRGRNLNQSSVKIRTEHSMYHDFHDHMKFITGTQPFLQNDSFLNEPASYGIYKNSYYHVRQELLTVFMSNYKSGFVSKL